jgi:hypothetical protein
MGDDLRKYLPTAETLRQRSDPKTIEEIQQKALDNPELDEALAAMKPWVKEGEDPLFFDVQAAAERKRRDSLRGPPATPPAQAGAPPTVKGKRVKVAWWSAALAILGVMSPVTGLWFWTHMKEPAKEAAARPVVEAGPSTPAAVCAPTVMELGSAVAEAGAGAEEDAGAKVRAGPKGAPAAGQVKVKVEDPYDATPKPTTSAGPSSPPPTPVSTSTTPFEGNPVF